jgi:hypothetical protein
MRLRVGAVIAATVFVASAGIALAFSVGGSSNPEGIDGPEALQIEGVWVFQHQPEFALTALHGGIPEIVNGCLYVDGAIVVWHVDRIEEAAGAIAAVRADESPQLLVGGGGISLEEGASPDQLPAVITDRCPTSTVWFGAP